MKSKMLPLGTDSFLKLRENDFYYVDKTLLIKELLTNWSEVYLFTRPRRFGKTLNMSMLRCFFDIGMDTSENRTFFDGLAITDEAELCEKHMGKYPVIFVSLKEINCLDFPAARKKLAEILHFEIERHQYLIESTTLSDYDKKTYLDMLECKSDDDIESNLYVLSKLLYRHFKQKIVLLIDEYDVPLDKAYHAGYYDEMIILIRNMLHQVLKTNEYLFFAVITGCLRVSKESIFTGLNNIRVNTISDVAFDEYFGFTDEEIKAMLAYYGLSDQYQTIKEWYDGYRFGNTDVYCPWDVINYCCDLLQNPNAQPQAYWSNTSGNDIVRKFIYKTQNIVQKREIEALIAGETVQKRIKQTLTYPELDSSLDNLWSVLYMTGYLTKCGESTGEYNDIFTLEIPNREIRMIFKEQIYEWFHDTVRKDPSRLENFCNLFPAGDAPEIEKQFTGFLMEYISIRDTNAEKARKENFYHGYLLGLLSYMGDWGVSSNIESGDGYCDIRIEIPNRSIGIIIEVKYAENNRLDEQCEKALQQIEDKNYEQSLLDEGYTTMLKYGIACYKKRCRVMLA